MKSHFDLVEDAIEDAEYCVSVYNLPFCLVNEENGFSVVAKKLLEPEDVILEIFNSPEAIRGTYYAPPVEEGSYRCLSCGSERMERVG